MTSDKIPSFDELMAANQALNEEKRGTGRTTQMIMNIEYFADQHPIYIVAHNTNAAKAIIARVAELRGADLAKRCQPIGLRGLDALRGKYTDRIYIDHFVWECQLSEKQRQFLELITGPGPNLWKMAQAESKKDYTEAGHVANLVNDPIAKLAAKMAPEPEKKGILVWIKTQFSKLKFW